MNLSKIFYKFTKNQAERISFLCLILVLCMIVYGAGVLYVNAAEISNKSEFGWEKMNDSETEEAVETFAPLDAGIRMPLNQKNIIRMANEDSIQMAQIGTIGHAITEKEYSILARIVEAEATGLDIKSKILVANVVLNRLHNQEFPNTIEEIVFQKVNGATQFSPVSDGRYYTVTVTESTIESVDRALNGEDYSQGALYFMERSMSDPKSVSWFENCLTYLFKYKGHEFYK